MREAVESGAARVLALRRLRPFWWRVAASLWFVPFLAVAGAVLLAAGLVELDAWLGVSLEQRWPRLFGAGQEGARGMLTAIASSMITVAGVVFSVTIVALSLAASQYSPRVLRTFTSDRPTQVVLGAFVAIYAYCLVVLRTIRGADGQAAFVPSLAVFGALVLAIVGLAVLVYFIHHLAESIQASAILLRVTRMTLVVIEQLFPEALDQAEPREPEEGEQGEWAPGFMLAAPATGYLVDLHAEELLAFARRCQRSMRVEAQVGEFVIAGQPLLALEGEEQLSKADELSLSACFALERQRTIEQDPAFGIQQIVDIASKALSPGINDPSTAVLGVDRLTQLLVALAGRRIEPTARREAGAPRVIWCGPSFESLVDLAYHALRHDAREQPIVLRRLLWSIGRVGAATADPARRRVLAAQAHRFADQARGRSDGDSAEILVQARQLGVSLRAAEPRAC